MFWRLRRVDVGVDEVKKLDGVDSGESVKMQIFEKNIAIFRGKGFQNQLKLPHFFEAIKKAREIT